MRSVLIRLYPASWRARYGDEFEALLEERPLGPFDVADVILGALDAQLRLRGRGTDNTQGRRFLLSLRIGGIAALGGVSLWALAFVLSSGVVGDVGAGGPSFLLLAGAVAMLVALAGLSAFQARTHPVLTWSAFGLAAVGTITCVAGIVGMSLVGDRPVVAGLSSWYLFFFGLFFAFAGSGLFAIATWRTATLSRGAALLLGVGSVLPFVAAPFANAEFVMVVALICYASGWFALGVKAIRLDQPASETRPA